MNQLGLTGIFFGFARIHPSDDTPNHTAVPTPDGTGSQSTTSTSDARPANLIRHLSDIHASKSSPVPGQSKSSHMKLDADAISALPAHTAPYPSNSVPGMDGDEKRRLGSEDGKIWPMVMSVGYNPYFKNEKVTAVCDSRFS